MGFALEPTHHGKTFRAHFEREQLTRDDPSHRAPGGGEEEDVNAHESDGGLLRGQIACTCRSAHDGHDELAHAHAHGAHEEEVAPAHFLDEVEAGEC